MTAYMIFGGQTKTRLHESSQESLRARESFGSMKTAKTLVGRPW